MADTPKVVYWGPQPSPYVVDRFNAVARRGIVQLVAWFDTWREADRSWSVEPDKWIFPYSIIEARGPRLLRARVPVRELLAAKPDVFVSTFDRFHTMAGSIASCGVARRTTLRCLPSYDAWSNRTVSGEVAKRFLFRAVDGVKVPGPDGGRTAARYGMQAERIWSVTQAIDTDLFGGALRIPRSTVRDERRALGLSGVVFVYVGRMWFGKGVQDLLAAFRALCGSREDVSLLLVGDGRDEGALRGLAEDLPNTRFLGHVDPSGLPRVLALADVLVFPTHGDPNGLVVEEAMAAGLPVIATTAAGDIRERLGVSGKRCGLVVDVGSAKELERAMHLLAGDPALRGVMKANALERVQRFTLDQYADTFEQFILGVLGLPVRENAFRRIANVAGRGARLVYG